jgi:hypothetical protein
MQDAKVPSKFYEEEPLISEEKRRRSRTRSTEGRKREF